MGIKIRIILIIVGVMVLVAFSTKFLSNTLNTETFSSVIERSLDNRFRLIEKEFEYNILSAREESAKISTTLSVVYNNVKDMPMESRDEYFKNFLSATVNESQLYFNRIVSILFHPQAIGNGNEPFTLYRYSTFNKEFTKINTTNKMMWDSLTNHYGQTYRSILRRQILKPYMINEGPNIGITFNISSTIPNMEDEEKVVGIANVGVLFN